MGFSRSQGGALLKTLQADVASGILSLTAVDWSEVHQIGERLSSRYTLIHGHRGFDILHVATALHLGADEFLSFDANQRLLADAEGLTTRP